MSNEQYQIPVRPAGAELRDRFLAGADPTVKDLLTDVADDDLAPLVQNLGGHDLGELLRSYAAADAVTDRPSVVFAYTVKGWGLPIAGDPLNHSALLTAQPDRGVPVVARVDGRHRVGPLRRRFGRRPGVRVGVGQRLQRPARRRGRTPSTSRWRCAARHLAAGRDARDVRTAPDGVGGPPCGPGTSGDHLTRRQRQHQPRRLDQQGRCVHADEEPDCLGEGRLLRWRQTPQAGTSSSASAR